jgi:hypothetical protein
MYALGAVMANAMMTPLATFSPMEMEFFGGPAITVAFEVTAIFMIGVVRLATPRIKPYILIEFLLSEED